jgi:hypothetical protein
MKSNSESGERFELPREKIFIDTAIARTKSALSLSEGPATVRFLNAVRSGEIRSWERRGPTSFKKLPPQSWNDADVDLDSDADTGSPNVLFLGKLRHIHTFLVAEDDLVCWLRTTRSSLAAQHTIPEPVRETRRDQGLVDRLLTSTYRFGYGMDYRNTPASAGSKATSASGHAVTDMPLITEMRELISSKAARNRWDAALLLSSKAGGGGTAESKAKRLVKRYSETFSSELNGED